MYAVNTKHNDKEKETLIEMYPINWDMTKN